VGFDAAIQNVEMWKSVDETTNLAPDPNPQINGSPLD